MTRSDTERWRATHASLYGRADGKVAGDFAERDPGSLTIADDNRRRGETRRRIEAIRERRELAALSDWN